MNQSVNDDIKLDQSTEGKIQASMERISQALRTLLWRESISYSLSPIQVQVLIFLLHHDQEKRNLSYLAGEFDLTKATLSDVNKVLVKKGLIRKESQPGDGRSLILHLTELGRSIARKTSLFADEIRKPIEKLPGKDKENLLGSLLSVIGHLNQAGVITVQRMCLNCAYYRPDNQEQTPYCALLNQKLAITDLRIDCPEHKEKS